MAEAIMNPRALRGYVVRGRLFVDSIERIRGKDGGQAAEPGKDDKVPTLSETLDDMVQALCFLQVPMQAIEADDDKKNPVYEELVCMQHGIGLLNKAWVNFDKGISALGMASREDEMPDAKDSPDEDID